MDIHPVHGSPQSWRDFSVHIAIVTVGIMIALSLEGLLEVQHNRHLVHSARETFRMEMRGDQDNLKFELQDVKQLHQAIHQVIVDLPALQHDPVQLKARVDKLVPSLYYLSSSSWTSGLSSGALAHMQADEVNRYAEFDFIVRSYEAIEDRALTQEYALRSFVDSHQAFDSNAMQETEEKLRAYEMLTNTMTHTGGQVSEVIARNTPN